MNSPSLHGDRRDWPFKQWGSVRAGYRWLDDNIDKDFDGNLFRFDLLARGPFFAAVLHG